MNYNTCMDAAKGIKEVIVSALGQLGISATLEAVTLEHPADMAHGDYATNAALVYAKQAAKSPRDLAASIVEKLGTIDGVEKIDIAGPGFINFTLSSQVLAQSLEAAIAQDMWGANDLQKGKKIMVEYTDPNPFKEFHIGHLMSNATGESISRLLQFSGAEIKRACYQGDVGLHVAKAIWGKLKNPESTWGKAYADGAQVYEQGGQVKDEINALNKKIYEKSDLEINALYDAGRKSSLEGFEKIYELLGTKFDYYFFESETGVYGKQVVVKHPEVFEKSDGATVYKGDEHMGLHTRVFINSEGLPTYEAKELGLSKIKYDTYPYDTSIVITGNEVNDYFKVLLDAMSKVFPELAAKTVHISHGMMRFAEGKMSSRTGNVITGESLINELEVKVGEKAEESKSKSLGELQIKRHHLIDSIKLRMQKIFIIDVLDRVEKKLFSKKTKESFSDVAVGAIKYVVLRQGSGKDIVFDPDKSLSLEGDSGPYLQYTFARTKSVVEKAFSRNIKAKVEVQDFKAKEISRIIHRFPKIVEYAADKLEPHIVAQYLLHLASAFNSWYAQEQILDGTPAAAHKVAITAAVNRTLKNGLWILGIPAPEKM